MVVPLSCACSTRILASPGVACSIFVAGSAVALKEQQEANKALDLQRKVLTVAGLMQEGEKITDAEVKQRFAKSIKPLIVDLKTGEVATDVDPVTYDQRKAAKDPSLSEAAPAGNLARVANLACRRCMTCVRRARHVCVLDKSCCPTASIGFVLADDRGASPPSHAGFRKVTI